MEPPPFEWSEIFNFPVDDQFLIDPSPAIDQISPESSDRVRKRDPKLACENFLAGRVPCACPELDEKVEVQAEVEEERLSPRKKRARVSRVGEGAWCQVPGCEVDISELKGYHRRHRVCLKCANAGSVVVDGENKRYCQQCGKFHELSDFDEDKRSCRRKLERHNNRRRRKPADSGGAEKESQKDLLAEDASSDGEAEKENEWSTNQITAREDMKVGTLSHFHSSLDSHNLGNDCVRTLTQVGKGVENSMCDNSPPLFVDKNAYSTVVVSHLNSMIGTLQNFLNNYDTKYIESNCNISVVGQHAH